MTLERWWMKTYEHGALQRQICNLWKKMGQTIATVTNEVVEEDDEVNEMGEFDITQV
jgi:hypothetical protein